MTPANPDDPDYYTLLGVQPEDAAEMIRRRYRQLMQQARKHPDLGGVHSEAALLNEAYAVLRHPQRRAAYDRVYLRHLASVPVPNANVLDATAAAQPFAAERRAQPRIAYVGDLLVFDEATAETGPGTNGQCRDLSSSGCSFRTLRPLQTGESVALVFQEDPGLTLRGTLRWRRVLPQRFGPAIYEGGVSFEGLDAQRFSIFTRRVLGSDLSS